MINVRTIGTSLDNNYRDDLNYNFGVLANEINGSGSLLEQTKQELLVMINSLQAQLTALGDTDWVGLSNQLNMAISESIVATQNATTATQAADIAIGKMNAIIDGFDIKGEYSATEQYRKFNNVYFEGSSYVYTADNPSTGNSPPNFPTVSNDYWRLSAAKGANGTGSVSTVNSKEPDPSGNVNLTASDIGAVSTNKIATTTDLGLIKPDGTTIEVDPITGIAKSLAKGVEVVDYSTGHLNDLKETGFYYSANTEFTRGFPLNGGTTPSIIEVYNGNANNIFQRIYFLQTGLSNIFIYNRNLNVPDAPWKTLPNAITDIPAEVQTIGVNGVAVSTGVIKQLVFGNPQTPTLNTGWEVNGSVPFTYVKVGNEVWIKGQIKSNIATPSTTLFTLPVGYRPDRYFSSFRSYTGSFIDGYVGFNGLVVISSVSGLVVGSVLNLDIKFMI